MKIRLALPLLALLGIALAEEYTSPKYTTRSCIPDRCIECLNGDCHETRHKREVSHEQNSSMSCIEDDGRKICTICEDVDCHMTIDEKREVHGNVNSTRSHNYSSWSYSSYSSSSSSSSCNATGCTRCKGLFPNGDGCEFVPYTLKREASTRTCKEGHCIECVDGVCHEDTCETTEQAKCQCEHVQEKCTRCMVDDPNSCVHFDKRELLARKREVNHNTATSKNCNNHGCHICENGNCRYEARGKRESMQSCSTVDGQRFCTICTPLGCHTQFSGGKRETGVQSTTKNCVNGRCIVCVNGQCNEMKNRKRTKSYSSSTTCTNGHCTRCINGNCTHYRESVAKVAE